MNKVLFLDLETTGLDASKHGIIQIAMLMEIDGKIEGELFLDVQPFPDDWITLNDVADFIQWKNIGFCDEATEDRVIEPSGIKLIDIANKHLPPKQVHKIILAFLNDYISKFDKTDKAYLAGYNVQFDRNFISQFFKKCGDNYLGSYLNWKCLDPLYLLWQMDADGEISLENYKLETACKHFGVELIAHNALSDVKGTYELYRKLRAKNEQIKA